MFYLEEILDVETASNYGLVTKFFPTNFDKSFKTYIDKLSNLSHEVRHHQS
jgi:hypothetical protein